MRIGNTNFSYKEKSEVWDKQKLTKTIATPIEKKVIYENFKRDIQMMDGESDEEMIRRVNQSKNMLKQISLDYYRELKRYSSEFINYHLPIVPDINPFRYEIHRMYYEMAIGLQPAERNKEIFNVSISNFDTKQMWAPFRLMRRVTGKYWDKYVPPIFSAEPVYEIGMWRLENQLQREFSPYFIRIFNYLFLAKKDLEKRKKKRSETNYWPTRMIATIVLALAPPRIRDVYDWYKFLIEPGLFTLLRRWVDIEPRPRKSILGEAIGQPPPQRSAIFNTKFHGTMGTLNKRSETSRKTWSSIFGDLFACVPTSMVLYPFSLFLKFQMSGISLQQARDAGLIWTSLPTYILRFTLSRVATLGILRYLPFRKVEKENMRLNREFSSRENNNDTKKNKRKQFHDLIFSTILTHWLSRIIDILAKAMVYPLHTIESRTATSFTMEDEKPKRKYESGYDCFEDIYENEGPSGFYKGFSGLFVLALIETVWSWLFLYPVATATVNTFVPNEEEE